MRFYFISLILLFTESIIFADEIDPDLIELRRELVQIQNELESDDPKSINTEFVQEAKFNEPDVNNNLTSNSLNELSVVSNTPRDEMIQIREELMNIQRELSNIGGEPSRTYNPGNRDFDDLSIEKEVQVIKEIEGAEDFDDDSQQLDEKSLIRQELLNIQKELNLLKSGGDTEVSSDPIKADFSNDIHSVKAVALPLGSGGYILMKDDFSNEIPSAKTVALPLGSGGYILPFVGISKTENLKWKSLGGDYDFTQSNGHSIGFRLGHRWNIWFMDFQLSHYENDLEALLIPEAIPDPYFDVHGKAKGLAYNASLGTKMYITQRAYLSLGVGLGASDQSISFELFDVVVEEEDVLLNYQFFAGLDYFPRDHFQIGMRYRWFKSEAMDLFSSQELHLAELSVGYSH